MNEAVKIDPVIDGATFRHVLGHYPTGVCVVTATGADGVPAGMVVGTFTSVSLDPPLVGFFPNKRSRSWPLIERAGKFCVNILSSDQLDVSRRFSSSGGDKFAGLSHGTSANGSPVLDGVVAWIDCTLYAVYDGGDHHIVLGRVQEMDIAAGEAPLLFFQGSYGQFSHLPEDDS